LWLALLVSDLGNLSDRNTVIPATRHVFLPDFKAKLRTGRKRLLVWLKDLLAVLADGLAVVIGKDHFEFGGANRFVGNIFQLGRDHVDLLLREILCSRDAQV